jgi:putative membrane protein
MKGAFGFTRNNYDRLGHLAQGFFPAVLFREVIFRRDVAKKGLWTEIFVFSVCMAFTAIFELIEFAAALTFSSGADAFLGSQGDVWDAQWDMTMCGVGALLSIALLRKIHLKELKLVSGASVKTMSVTTESEK